MANSEAINLQDVPIVPIDVVDPPVGGSTSGCQQADYDAAPDRTGKVALIQRGECSFVAKWALAEDNGAVGVIIYNEGFTPARQNPIFVDNGIDTEIAAVITSYPVGHELLQAYKSGANPTVDFVVNARFTDRFLPQVLAETTKGDKNNVVVVGAPPRLRDRGPGHQRRRLRHGDAPDVWPRSWRSSRYKLQQQIRFMFFGAEEDGLVGSQYYAHSLSDAEVAKIDVMLDYDMLASANYARFVYDGDGSEPGNEDFKGPEGSGFIEQLHDDWFDAQGQLQRADPVRRPLRLRRLHRRGHPGRRHLLRRRGPEDGGAGGHLRRRRRLGLDPCYHEACDNTTTVFTGIPPLDAGGLDGVDATRSARRRRARRWPGSRAQELRRDVGRRELRHLVLRDAGHAVLGRPHGQEEGQGEGRQAPQGAVRPQEVPLDAADGRPGHVAGPPSAITDLPASPQRTRALRSPMYLKR